MFEIFPLLIIASVSEIMKIANCAIRILNVSF